MNAISNSYGGGDASPDPAYDQPGIAVVASAGDADYGASYPASDPHVVAVGGTKLTLTAAGTYGSETVWNSGVDEGTGSGCSADNAAQAWQTATAGWSLTGCGEMNAGSPTSPRTPTRTPARPSTTPSRTPSRPATRLVAGRRHEPVGPADRRRLRPRRENASSTAYPASLAYRTKKGLHDVSLGDNVGSSGDCGTTMCHAHAGYDGPTGMGTPKGISSF